MNYTITHTCATRRPVLVEDMEPGTFFLGAAFPDALYLRTYDGFLCLGERDLGHGYPPGLGQKGTPVDVEIVVNG